LIADGDMHLKNMALLKIAKPGDRQFSSVRMAPLYDAVTTRIFPNLNHDHMALLLNGKDNNLRRADFRALAATAGLRAADADAAIDDLMKRLSAAVDRLTLPEKIDLTDDARKMVDDMRTICRARIEALA